MKTLAQVTEATGFEVLEHLALEAEVPVLDGLQAQGDLLIVPMTPRSFAGAPEVPAEGIAVIEAAAGGHEHRLFAGAPHSVRIQMLAGGGQDIAHVEVQEAAYLLHPEHGATGLARGTYVLRRQREQADEERLVAD